MPITYLISAYFGLNIIFSDNAQKTCGIEQESRVDKVSTVVGCQYGKTIVLQLGRSEKEMNHTLGHEEGHFLFLKDDKVKNVIRRYMPLKTYSKNYNTQDKIINEMVADYFSDYIYDPDFSKKYPELYELFTKKLDYEKLYFKN